MLSGDELEARRTLAGSGDLAALAARLVEKSAPVLERMPIIPQVKALMSVDGGVCDQCGGQLGFDPWSPDRHHCTGCGAVCSSDRHHRHWARAQHLWVAGRAAHLATEAAITGYEAAAARAREILAGYFDLYHALPNRDNVLGPSHLFFSTYLESIWLLDYLAAAWLLREIGALSEEDVEAVNGVVDEAARLIGEFDEGMSNRQTWNAAALTAVAVWFGDEELAQSAIAGRTGLLGHLTEGFGADGMWHEGENYHLFAVRGLLIGLHWASAAGAELLGDPLLAASLGRALMAPAATALPDGTFPARKDSRYGVSLAHPAYLETWELGLARLGEDAPAGLAGWLLDLYGRPASIAQTYDAYLHDAGEPARERTGRADLSWLMLLAMSPEPLAPGDAEESSGGRYLPDQGLAILRHHDRYVSLECGPFTEGHGHPDRLHLTVVDHGVPWLADPGTGSYVSRDLFWYRSTLAHGAPRFGGESQSGGDARCVAFDHQGDWGWIVAEWSNVRRTVVSGPEWLVDLVEWSGRGTTFELPWHLDGEVTVETPGGWSAVELAGAEVSGPERFTPEGGGDVVIRGEQAGRTVRLHLIGGTLIRATGPGRPGGKRRPFFVVRDEAGPVRLAAVLDFNGQVSTVAVGPDRVEVRSGGISLTFSPAACRVSGPGVSASLSGAIPASPRRKPFLSEKPILTEGRAFRIEGAPALDGSLDGFDTGSPIELADESHYYRSEEAWDGRETFSATAWLNWDLERLYLAVEVVKPDVVIRGRDAAPLGLDNEPDDIHSDGIQVYYQIGESSPARAFLIRPDDDGGLIARPIPGGPDVLASLEGGSSIQETGYTLTVALPAPEIAHADRKTLVRFDLCVNEMRPDRQRRAGQLAWGGGNGWVYLRGDRRDPARWGVLELD